MSGQLSKDDLVVWDRLVQSHKTFSTTLRDFLDADVDRVGLVRRSLRGKDRSTAVYLLRSLSISELQELFGDLVFLASFSHGAIHTIRDTILCLPQEWVLGKIEDVAEPLLSDGTYDEYRRLLELYIELDYDLALRLAQRAAGQQDEDIREAGEDFLEKLGRADESKRRGSPQTKG